jgi:hypothetical protein
VPTSTTRRDDDSRSNNILWYVISIAGRTLGDLEGAKHIFQDVTVALWGKTLPQQERDPLSIPDPICTRPDCKPANRERFPNYSCRATKRRPTNNQFLTGCSRREFFGRMTRGETFPAVGKAEDVRTDLLVRLEYCTFENVGSSVPSYVTKYLQVLRIVWYVKYSIDGVRQEEGLAVVQPVFPLEKKAPVSYRSGTDANWNRHAQMCFERIYQRNWKTTRRTWNFHKEINGFPKRGEHRLIKLFIVDGNQRKLADNDAGRDVWKLAINMKRRSFCKERGRTYNLEKNV